VHEEMFYEYDANCHCYNFRLSLRVFLAVDFLHLWFCCQWFTFIRGARWGTFPHSLFAHRFRSREKFQ